MKAFTTDSWTPLRRLESPFGCRQRWKCCGSMTPTAPASSSASRSAAWLCDSRRAVAPLGKVHLSPLVVLTNRKSKEAPRLLANRDARTKVNSCRIYMLKVRGQIGPVMSRIELDHMLGESQRRHP